MSEQKYIRWLSVIVILLVSLVTIISFILSYEALWSFALAGGKPANLAWLWPVIIDLPIVVFSVVSLFAIAMGYNPWPFRVVVGLVTLGTVYFNYSYAVGAGLSWQVYITAPIMYFVSFEVLAWVIKIVSERSVLITKMAEISAKLGVLEIEYKGKKDNLESGLANESRRLNEAMENNRLELANQISQLESQQARLEEEITAKAKTLDSYAQDVAARREELKSLEDSQAKIFVPANLSIDQRRELVNRMSQEGMTIEAIAKALGCSVGTVKNDKVAIKAMADPADLQMSTGGTNGHGKE